MVLELNPVIPVIVLVFGVSSEKMYPKSRALSTTSDCGGKRLESLTPPPSDNHGQKIMTPETTTPHLVLMVPTNVIRQQFEALQQEESGEQCLVITMALSDIARLCKPDICYPSHQDVPLDLSLRRI